MTSHTQLSPINATPPTSPTSDDHDTSETIRTPNEPTPTPARFLVHGDVDSPSSPIEEFRREAEEGRKGFGRLNLSKSVSSLRAKAKGEKKEKARSGLGRARAMSVSEEKVVITPTTIPSNPTPMSTSSSKPVRPKPQRSGSSFSSFIRKLTGRSAPPSDTETGQAVNTAPSTRSRSTEPEPKPILPRLDTSPQAGLAPPPASAPAAVPTQAHLPEPLPALPLEVEPHAIPLPLSPITSPTKLPEIDDAKDFVVLAPPIAFSGPSLKRVKQNGMLSLEGLDFREEDEVLAHEDDKDIVKPLTSPGTPSPPTNGCEHPTISATRSTTDERTNCPSSTTEDLSPVTDRVAMVIPSGTAPAGLGRKESKLRKSMMGLAETLNGRKVQKPTSTSYDASLARQRHLAANRVSRAPTQIRSTASVPAGTREIKDKESGDLSETFFLS
ncbi:MAG: hypothetical protein TREMPRED_004385 [Tremellales sp. Tagirdzhanova-0007]|nr:MAG: hypothetical protein TREMPRED_004385 [Tremellales sp. Tagirdzhanova-0007]